VTSIVRRRFGGKKPPFELQLLKVDKNIYNLAGADWGARNHLLHESVEHVQETHSLSGVGDVFRGVERETHVQARWISASFAPMSLGHEPRTDFEKEAARKIAKREKKVETIEEGYYRRAGSISLHGGCVSCHGGAFANQSTSPKFAGLIISIPVEASAQLESQREP
jgi:hypothetical protein